LSDIKGPDEWKQCRSSQRSQGDSAPPMVADETDITLLEARLDLNQSGIGARAQESIFPGERLQ